MSRRVIDCACFTAWNEYELDNLLYLQSDRSSPNHHIKPRSEPGLIRNSSGWEDQVVRLRMTFFLLWGSFKLILLSFLPGAEKGKIRERKAEVPDPSHLRALDENS